MVDAGRKASSYRQLFSEFRTVSWVDLGKAEQSPSTAKGERSLRFVPLTDT